VRIINNIIIASGEPSSGPKDLKFCAHFTLKWPLAKKIHNGLLVDYVQFLEFYDVETSLA